jgi:LPXTG-motif cell wall-anchored protein
MHGYGDEARFDIQRPMFTLLTLLLIGLAWFAWVRRKKLGRL